jgi:hypothetical protein
MLASMALAATRCLQILLPIFYTYMIEFRRMAMAQPNALEASYV